MTARLFRIVPGGPSPDVSQRVAELKQRLRRGDIRAVAFVLVNGSGVVSTGFAGNDDGFLHQMVSGTETLRMRLRGKD